LRVINRGPGPPVLGSLKSETIKCGHESHGTLSCGCLHCQEPAAIVNDRPILSSERKLHKGYERKGSIEEKIEVMSLNGHVTKMNSAH
jgi:hypothetical protein